MTSQWWIRYKASQPNSCAYSIANGWHLPVILSLMSTFFSCFLKYEVFYLFYPIRKLEALLRSMWHLAVLNKPLSSSQACSLTLLHSHTCTKRGTNTSKSSSRTNWVNKAHETISLSVKICWYFSLLLLICCSFFLRLDNFLAIWMIQPSRFLTNNPALHCSSWFDPFEVSLRTSCLL